MTFHVRLISLPSQTSGLVEALTSEAGVSNLVVLPGTAQRLGGDAVQFDVAPRSANAVFRQLKAFRDDRSGASARLVGVVSLTEARASALRTGRAIPERAGRRLATSCQVTAWTLAQSAAMSITVHWWSAAAAARIWSVPLPRMGSTS